MIVKKSEIQYYQLLEGCTLSIYIFRLKKICWKQCLTMAEPQNAAKSKGILTAALRKVKIYIERVHPSSNW